MSDAVGTAYDAMVELYAQVNLDALEQDSNARDWLARFAHRAALQTGPVVDVGCGPGHIVDHLCDLGLPAVGYDISAGQIAKARKTFPGRTFHLGDLASLEIDDASTGGIVSRYSVIHMDPSDLHEAFEEWVRVLAPGAPLLMSFFGSLSAEEHGTPFDHKVTTAYELCPATIAHQLEDAGFIEIEINTLPARPESRRRFDQATIVAEKPAS